MWGDGIGIRGIRGGIKVTLYKNMTNKNMRLEMSKNKNSFKNID